MTDATTTLSDAQLLSRMLDEEGTSFRRWVDENRNSRTNVEWQHVRECDGCAGNLLRQFHEAHRDNVLNRSLREYDAWRAYVGAQHTDAEQPLQEWERALVEPTPEPESPVDAEIRVAFPGAIPDDKLAKLRALVTERNELRAKLAEQSAEIDLSDKRLWPAFGKVAAAADEAGYCAEYDRMSEAGGFPTREELREAGLIPAKEYTANVYVDVDVSFTTRVRVTTPSFEAANYDDAVDEARENIEDMLDDDDVLAAVRAERSDVPYDATVEWTLSYVNSVELA